MITEALLVATAAVSSGFIWARSRRSRLYRQLESRIETLPGEVRLDLGNLMQQPSSGFAKRLVVIPEALPEATVAQLCSEAQHLVRPERTYIPIHKKGGTVAYETLFQEAPSIVALYHSQVMRDAVSRIVGEAVRPTPVHDQSSLSVLFYDKPGDHIGWHYDHNFYRGRHFTVLLPVINQGSASGGLSHAMLKTKIDGGEMEVATPVNTLILFEGACVNHKVEPIIEGERRLVISMTYCTDPRAHALQGAVRRIKDIAFFGPRALWT